MFGLVLRSTIVLGILFGLFFAVAAAALYFVHAPVYIALIVAVVLCGLNYWLGPWIIGLCFKIRWVEESEIPPYIATPAS